MPGYRDPRDLEMCFKRKEKDNRKEQGGISMWSLHVLSPTATWMTSSSASSSSASSSPSSHSNSNSHYNYIPVPAAPPFSAERPFRILTPASVQAQHKRKRDVLDEGRGCERVVGGGVGTGAGVTVSVSGSSFGPTGKIKAKRKPEDRSVTVSQWMRRGEYAAQRIRCLSPLWSGQSEALGRRFFLFLGVSIPVSPARYAAREGTRSEWLAGTRRPRNTWSGHVCPSLVGCSTMLFFRRLGPPSLVFVGILALASTFFWSWLSALLNGCVMGPKNTSSQSIVPRIYNDNGDLLSAIHAACLEDAAVDFSGSYSVSGDPLSDKERVQSVTHDIWKATGYRFTVKDHPRTDRGHKTRLWCSQDAARRSKHRGPGDAPRISKQGELFAKPRYACRSRLMISSIPDDEGATSTSTVTVRLHHYVRHEAYFDAVPPARAQGQQQQRTQTQTQQTQQQTQTQPAQTQPTQGIAPQFRTAITATLPPHIMGHLSAPPPPPPPPPPLHRREGEWDEVERPEREWEDDEPPFQARMRAHIARIRDFCDGLEFQVQFNDHRMLAALERDAGAFLGLVDDCLRQEGRG
ncbi:hypothetical protein C8J57DRAFT_1216830 [Mycena rebaudengoi]|nr:hypothetical protein C8J57DRAFT_1216830 [Mycena rebaudengoi]